MDIRSALLYAKLNHYKALVNKTNGFIKWALSKVNNPYVACSFGKDSAVMLHLILQHKRDIPVRFIRWKNETEYIDNYDDTIKKWGDINLTQVEFSRETLSDNRIDRYQTSGFDSYFIGLRMEESVTRRITLKTHGIFYRNSSEIIRISPLADWKTADIAAYMYSNDLPILNSYLEVGVNSRTSARIPRADFGIRESFLASLKNRDFQAFQNLLLSFPEIKEYV